MVYAPGTAEARTRSYDWDDASGWLKSSTDVDNALTTEYTYDALGRPLTVTEAGERKTAIDYDDRNRRVTTSSDLFTLGDGKLQTIAQHDMLGRVVETRVSDGDALSTSDGIEVTTDYIHTAGAPLKVVTSAPYRPPADATLERTCTQFDRLGRPTAIGVFRGAAAPAGCETDTDTRTGLTRIAYIADQTTITDPAGKTRVEFRDALGRLTQVTEDPGADPKLNYVTTYNYDPLDNLTGVFQYGHYEPPGPSDPPVQPVQSRSFKYSSLSRLRSATNPESGTTRYTYHDAGTLATRTDARGVSAKYGYDALQRLKTIEYTIPPDPAPETPHDWPAPTPDVTYRYHMSGSPNIGQLESIFSDAAKAIYNSYDALGRVKSMSQTIAGHPDTFTFANTYYKNDALDTQTYPSGRSVEYTLDDAGRVETVSDGTTTSDDATTYADMSVTAGHAYAPDGRLRQMLLGNGLWETRDYDRLETPQGQPRRLTTRFKLVTPDETTMLPGATERVALGYLYSGTANNGNPMSHTITRSGTTWTQTFGYDGVNRLKTATETNGYNREFGYDAFGNRWVASNTHTTPSIVVQESHEPRFQSQFDAATNRMTTSTVAYDAAGNQTLYSPHRLVYDAENRLVSMTHPSSGSGTYLYDGQGRRVRKTWTPGGGTAADTYYVYDIAGNLAAEYGTGTAPPSGTLYPFTDMLGSVRAVTDAAGTVVECYDYLPFGRMLSSSDNGRSASCHPESPDTALDSDVSQKFTGQIRDEETRLDYFKARYMSAPQGRFMSIDPLLASADAALPQSWNRYSYVMNNPMRFVDPTGKAWIPSGSAEEPYTWVDSCDGLDEKDGCMEAIAIALHDKENDVYYVKVYGSGGRDDIEVIRPPMGSALIDVNDIANHRDSSLVNDQFIYEDYLSATNAAGLFSVSVGYRSMYPQDGPLSFSGGSFADGGRLEGRGRYSHLNGNNFDLRYMGPGGQAIQGPRAATLADPGRVRTIIRLAGTHGLGGAVTGYPDRFGGLPARASTRAAHMDHIHFNRGR